MARFFQGPRARPTRSGLAARLELIVVPAVRGHRNGSVYRAEGDAQSSEKLHSF